MLRPAKIVEISLAAGLYYSGLVMLARRRLRRSGKRLIILCYHRANSEHLLHQMAYLKRHYRLLHLDAAYEELQQPEPSHVKTSPTLLTLTFDDGYKDNYTRGFAYAQKLHVPFTIFLVPDSIDHNRPFAWLAGEDNHLVPFAQTKEVMVNDHIYHLDSLQEQNALNQEINTCVRNATSVVEREEFLSTMRALLSVPTSPTEREQADMPLTWDDVHTMGQSGLVSFGAHTLHHPILTYLADPQEAYFEVAECRNVLEQRLGHPVRTFAYPYGKPEQVVDIGVNAVQAAQYEAAVTTVHGFNTPQTDSLQLHRIVVDAEDHWLVLAAKASGLWVTCMNLIRKPVGLVARLLGRQELYDPYH